VDRIEGLIDDSIEVTRHEGCDPLIEVSCTCVPGVSARDIAADLERVWLPEIRYQFFEAHRVRDVPEGIELAFITQMSEGSLYVTGRVLIRG
jgi:hypothetical protein